MPVSRKISSFAWIAVVASAIGCCAFWRLQEDDIFWQLRAGQEIVSALHVPTTDSWSYTEQGEPWINYQWLSQVTFHVIHALGGVDGLIFARVALIASLFAAMGLLFARSQSTFAFVVAAPLIFVGMIFRMHLRPETMGLVLFALMFWLWPQLRDDDARARMRARVLSTAALWLWANLHGGTAIFGLALNFVAMFAFGRNIKERATWIAASLAVFFATPIHVNIVPALIAHARYSTDVLSNTEWLPVQAGMFSYEREGFSFLSWGALTVLGLVAMIGVALNRLPLPQIYGDKRVMLAVGVVLTALSFARIRCIPYQLIFFIPLWATLAANVKKSAITLGALSWLIVLPIQLSRAKDLYGWGINEDLYAPRLIEAVKRMQPQGRLFTTFEVGSLQVWRLPEYPDFADPRDKIFDDVKAEYVAAFNEPAAMQALVSRWDVNAVIIDYPEATHTPDGGLWSPLAFFFAGDQWAVVAFDRKKVLLLKRTPENASIIEQNEFKFATPLVPATFHVFRRDMSEQDRERLERELRRCLSFAPDIAYCEIVHAASLLRSSERNKLEQSIQVLERVIARASRSRAAQPSTTAQMLLDRAREKLSAL